MIKVGELIEANAFPSLKRIFICWRLVGSDNELETEFWLANPPDRKINGYLMRRVKKAVPLTRIRNNVTTGVFKPISANDFMSKRLGEEWKGEIASKAIIKLIAGIINASAKLSNLLVKKNRNLLLTGIDAEGKLNDIADCNII